MEKNPLGRPKVVVPINYSLLRQIRLRNGVTQKYIAEVLGYSPARVAQFESGYKGGVPIDALQKIAKILDIDYNKLLIKETQP